MTLIDIDPEMLENYNNPNDQNKHSNTPEMSELIDFEADNTGQTHIIKVIGVGGGGSNAVTNMYLEQIEDVDFIICNTDKQALARSPVPIKLQLGSELTSGLGAGNDPRIGRDAARESIDEIKQLLSDGTKMVFITAGMGGGTGTGAAPVIASIAREMDILTVAIVTLPFRFEGIKRLKQAVEGIQELKKNVDALLLIDNERIQEVYGEAPAREAFKKADQVLTIAAKGIADIINKDGIINVDFADVRNILKDSGIAIMGTGYGEGQNRSIDAADKAIHSPLLNFLNIKGAKKLLFNIFYSPEEELIVNEIKSIAQYIQRETGNIPDTIWGYSDHPNLEKGQISVTIIATGFNANIDEYLDQMLKEFSRNYGGVTSQSGVEESKPKEAEPKIVFPESEQVEEQEVTQTDEPIFAENYSDLVNSFERKPMEYQNIRDIEEIEKQPAFLRFGYRLDTKSKESDDIKFITIIRR